MLCPICSGCLLLSCCVPVMVLTDSDALFWQCWWNPSVQPVMTLWSILHAAQWPFTVILQSGVLVLDTLLRKDFSVRPGVAAIQSSQRYPSIGILFLLVPLLMFPAFPVLMILANELWSLHFLILSFLFQNYCLFAEKCGCESVELSLGDKRVPNHKTFWEHIQLTVRNIATLKRTIPGVVWNYSSSV